MVRDAKLRILIADGPAGTAAATMCGTDVTMVYVARHGPVAEQGRESVEAGQESPASSSDAGIPGMSGIPVMNAATDPLRPTPTQLSPPTAN